MQTSNNWTVRSERAGLMLGVPGRFFAVVARPDGRILNQRYITEALEYKHYGQRYRIRAEVRFDDSCGNGHESFAITGETHRAENGYWREDSGGCIHDLIAEHFPHLAPLIKWHLCSTDGPMHYLANTVYLAGDRDYRGLRKGETRQIRNGRGELAWIMRGQRDRYHDGATPPDDVVTLKWEPWNITGEGKARELNSARQAAIWPEATDEELCLEPEALRAVLANRLPALLAEFKAAMLGAGLLWPERR